LPILRKGRCLRQTVRRYHFHSRRPGSGHRHPAPSGWSDNDGGDRCRVSRRARAAVRNDQPRGFDTAEFNTPRACSRRRAGALVCQGEPASSERADGHRSLRQDVRVSRPRCIRVPT
jgi:hypothetical protein